MSQNIQNIQKIFHRATSDPLAIKISLSLKKGKHKNFATTTNSAKKRLRIDNTTLRGKGKNLFQNKVSDFLTSKTSPSPNTFEEFETFVVDAAKECAEVEIIVRIIWFAENELELLLKIELRL